MHFAYFHEEISYAARRLLRRQIWVFLHKITEMSLRGCLSPRCHVAFGQKVVLLISDNIARCSSNKEMINLLSLQSFFIELKRSSHLELIPVFDFSYFTA